MQGQRENSLRCPWAWLSEGQRRLGGGGTKGKEKQREAKRVKVKAVQSDGRERLRQSNSVGCDRDGCEHPSGLQALVANGGG